MNRQPTIHRWIAASIGATLAACSASTSEDGTRVTASEDTGQSGAAIINGTDTSLAQNSFVQIPLAGCTGTLLDNQWALTANHCNPAIGTLVFMDAQFRTAARVVPHPNASLGIDVALVKLSAPMTVAGTTTQFRRLLRPSIAPNGTHVRCFGYGENFNSPGTSPQLRRMELGTLLGGWNFYLLERNALLQSAAPGDAGGACLDDGGFVVGVMLSMPWTPTSTGETAAVVSTSYQAWAESVISSCSTNADCLTGVCNIPKQKCVASTCQDGVQDHGETGVDCGGLCPACPSLCPPNCYQKCISVCRAEGTPINLCVPECRAECADCPL